MYVSLSVLFHIYLFSFSWLQVCLNKFSSVQFSQFIQTATAYSHLAQLQVESADHAMTLFLGSEAKIKTEQCQQEAKANFEIK